MYFYLRYDTESKEGSEMDYNEDDFMKINESDTSR